MGADGGALAVMMGGTDVAVIGGDPIPYLPPNCAVEFCMGAMPGRGAGRDMAVLTGAVMTGAPGPMLAVMTGARGPMLAVMTGAPGPMLVVIGPGRAYEPMEGVATPGATKDVTGFPRFGAGTKEPTDPAGRDP
mmetsp:Transcript_45031/g.104302  ORF Transcript_45031/g.104302 Transcript_45031/m.104302 type:complete len:134 (+) Transcript_45031:1799-2200(+)